MWFQHKLNINSIKTLYALFIKEKPASTDIKYFTDDYYSITSTYYSIDFLYHFIVKFTWKDLLHIQNILFIL